MVNKENKTFSVPRRYDNTKGESLKPAILSVPPSFTGKGFSKFSVPPSFTGKGFSKFSVPPSFQGKGVRGLGSAAAFLSLAISSCARLAPPPAPRPVMVEIPIATPIYCQVPKLQPPILAIAALTPDSPPADTVRSYAASVDVLKSAVHERDTILEACAPPAGANTPPPISPPAPHALSKDDSKAEPLPIQSRLISVFCKLVSWPNYLFSSKGEIK